MDIKESLRIAFKEFILPELDKIKEDNKEIKINLVSVNKRLDDINIHLVDQSRRIDETNKRIDALREDLTLRIDAVREDLTLRIDAVREDLTQRIDGMNNRMDRLYEVIVRKEEHYKLEQRVANLEIEINQIKTKLAA
ncbi:MAG: hypothetical protein SV062_06275 [Thermodesulfobacteriota bacterium]|nr:hypothetical protein [Thermodesulfobacteriota bacterium]